MNTSQNRWAALVCVSLVVAVMFGACTRSSSVEDEDSGDRVRVEAYSFASRIWRDGKMNRFTMELYRTDSMAVISGKAYLGTGVFRGRVTSDSVTLYFPTEKQYFTESVAQVFSTTDCPLPIDNLDLVSLLVSTPDSLPVPVRLEVAANYRKKRRASFLIYDESCSWQLEMTYRLRKDGWRPESFEFDGEKLRIKAELQQYRRSAGVRERRLRLRIPEGAERIGL